jgi:acyl-[acyl-carrier-protein]-phospholipid O-acyltransferase / long-chain-fatty-acid--[acyl-carrier-protein] ligase
MQFLFTKRFLPLFVTQFLGAFNDNFLKNALVVLITYRLASQTGDNPQILVALAAALFILPYFLFSATSGQLADKIERSRIARTVKIVEICLMILAAIGFHYSNTWFLMAVLFGMGVHSTFFGPIKYSLLPQHLKEKELLSGNAYVEAGTFLAILLGTLAGGLLILQENGDMITAALLIGIAVLGYISSRFIPNAPAPEPQLTIGWNVFKETARLISSSRKDKTIFQTILGISWFWLIGATFLAQFPAYAKLTLNADETVVTLFLTIFSIGIGIGSFLCNRLLRGEVKLTYTFWSAVGITIFALDLSLASAHPHVFAQGTLVDVSEFVRYREHWRVLVDLMGVAICGGMYIVPLYAYLQHYGDKRSMARLIAANNVMNAVYMVGSSVAIMAMVSAGMTIPQIFMAVAVSNGIIAVVTRRSYKMMAH